MAADAEAALVDAARRGTARQVRAACALVRSTTGGDIDRRFGLGDVTPLHVAANFGQVRLFVQDSSDNARSFIREVFVFLAGDKYPRVKRIQGFREIFS